MIHIWYHSLQTKLKSHHGDNSVIIEPPATMKACWQHTILQVMLSPRPFLLIILLLFEKSWSNQVTSLHMCKSVTSFDHYNHNQGIFPKLWYFSQDFSYEIMNPLWNESQEPVLHLNIKTFFPGMGIPMLKIRQSQECLIFNMWIPLLVRRHLYIETGPRLPADTVLTQYKRTN